MRSNSKILAVVAAAALLLIVAACGSKVSQANFEKIQTDMTQEEVQKILGPPTETSGMSIGSFSGGTSTWTSGDSTISIQFLNGKVVAKQFYKPGEKPSQKKKNER